MTERTRMWRWMDMLVVTGLLLLLLGLPVMGAAPRSEDQPAALEFDVPWPRVGDHLTYDIFVDDENGRRAYGPVMEVTRRVAALGEVPVKAAFVEERWFPPLRVEEGALVLESRGWVDRFYYAEGGALVYQVGSGVRPSLPGDGNLTPLWLEIEWEGQVSMLQQDIDHIEYLGGHVAHTPDDASMMARLIDLGVTNDVGRRAIGTTVEANYGDERLYGLGPGAGGTFQRAVDALFPPAYDEPCRMLSLMQRAWANPQMPVVAYWATEGSDCRASSGAWMHPDHPGAAGLRQRVDWSDGRHAAMDLVPRLIAPGEGPEFRPLDRWGESGSIRLTPAERLPRDAPQVSAMEIDQDPRPLVRNLSLPLLRQAMALDGPDCVADLLDADARVTAFWWRDEHSRPLPETLPGPRIDLPRLPTGHESGAWAAVYTSTWQVMMMTDAGHATNLQMTVQETYPGPRVEVTKWHQLDDGPCSGSGIVEDPDVQVVPPAELAAQARRQVRSHVALPEPDPRGSLPVFSFQPMFDWVEGEGTPFHAQKALHPPGEVSEMAPDLEGHIGAARFLYREPQGEGWHIPIGGFLSADDGGVIGITRWNEAGPERPPATAATTDADLVRLVPRPIATGLGVLAIAAWVLARGASALKAGAHFPAVAWLYAKIRDADVLMHERRAAIVAALRADPGLTASEMAKRLGLAWGATVHHLERLRQAGVVRTVRDGRRRRYTLTDDPTDPAALLAKSPERARLLALVAAEPGISAAEIAKRLERDRSSVTRLAARLVEAELVRRERDGRRVRFYPATKSKESL